MVDDRRPASRDRRPGLATSRRFAAAKGDRLEPSRYPPRVALRRRCYGSGANCPRGVLGGAVPAPGRTGGGRLSHAMRVRDAAGRRGSAPEEPESAAATGVLTRIGVRTADHPTERRIPAAAAQLGVRGLEACRFWTVYHLEGLLSDADVARLCAEVLVDPVTDTVIVGEPDGAAWAVEVAPLAGVTDGAARELERAAAVLGLPPLRAERRPRRSRHRGPGSPAARQPDDRAQRTGRAGAVVLAHLGSGTGGAAGSIARPR